MWQTGYAIFFFSYDGTVYNASGIAISESIENLFYTEDEGWRVLKSLHGLNEKLVFTVMPIMFFDGNKDE